MPMIRVVIGDDDQAFREAVTDVLAADPRFAVVAAVASGYDLRLVAAEVRPDVALVDIRMPGGGAEVVRGLVEDARALADTEGHARSMAIVALSAHTGVHDVRAMVAAGASGYLAKGHLGDTLPDLVHRCASGEVVLAVPAAAKALTSLISHAKVEVTDHR